MTSTTINTSIVLPQATTTIATAVTKTTITAVQRVFKTGSTTFPDPGPAYSPEQVKEFYQTTHGFLINFEVDGPSFIDGVEHYEFI